MKKSSIFKKVSKGLHLILLVTVLGTFTQCKKAIEDLVNPTSTIKFINSTYTTIDITFNSETKSIIPGGSVSFTSNVGSYATGNASTSGKTSIGTQVGLLMTWSLSETFPGRGVTNEVTLDVTPTYFFLKIQNTSTKSIQKVYVNYGLTSQTIDNISIPNDGGTYFIGYYRAYSNSNVRAESGTTIWNWSPLNLSFTTNQSKTVLAF